MTIRFEFLIKLVEYKDLLNELYLQVLCYKTIVNVYYAF